MGIHAQLMDKKYALKLWRGIICGGITAEMKAHTPNYSEDFGWHIFSFGLIRADEANAAEFYNAKNKDGIILFFEHSRDAFMLENAVELTAEELDLLARSEGFSYANAYVFHPADRWTYVRTHEKSLGPYFYEISG